jgi:hypothetical protein
MTGVLDGVSAFVVVAWRQNGMKAEWAFGVLLDDHDHDKHPAASGFTLCVHDQVGYERY